MLYDITLNWRGSGIESGQYFGPEMYSPLYLAPALENFLQHALLLEAGFQDQNSHPSTVWQLAWQACEFGVVTHSVKSLPT